MVAATICCAPFGTSAKAFLMKCVRHRCQLVPCSTAAIAALSPSWASEMTSLTPPSPRLTKSRRKSVQKTSASDGPMFGDAPWPCGAGDGNNTDDGSEVGVTKDSITIATGDDAGYAASPGLNHETTDAMKALAETA